MNPGCGSFELAHARVGARLGARPTEALWQRIEAARGLAAVLELARGGALAPWVEGIGPASPLHAVECTLRRHWRARVAELASWMPPRWQAALRECALLADLPLVQHLARGGGAPAWIDEADADGTLRRRAEVHRAAPERVLRAWIAAWRVLLPRGPARAAIEAQLLPLLEHHAAALAEPGPADGWALRRALQQRLLALRRRALVEPLAVFAYLGLVALEYERLRGELVARAAFPVLGPCA
jgi:hypothetical protein